jgi:hypothetical protein
MLSKAASGVYTAKTARQHDGSDDGNGVRCGMKGHMAGNKKADGSFVCTQVCDECGSRLCPACRPGVTCAVMADVMPPRDKMMNGINKKYAKEVYEHLVAFRAKKRTSLGMAVKVARVDASAGESGDENVMDQYHVL